MVAATYHVCASVGQCWPRDSHGDYVNVCGLSAGDELPCAERYIIITKPSDLLTSADLTGVYDRN